MKALITLILSVCLVTVNFTQTGRAQSETGLLLGGEEVTAAEALSQYLQIPSCSGSEKIAGQFLQELCGENGLHITPMGQEDGNFNFAASILPLDLGLPNIIFLNHIDVVPAGDTSQWTQPPFSGKILDGDIWGRGAFDNKGPAVMQLASIIQATHRLDLTSLPYNVTLLAVSCEETQCEGGIRYVIEHYLDALNPAVVIGEGPPSLDQVLRSDPSREVFGISVAHKRPLWLELELEIATSGHGSVPPVAYANKELTVALNRLLKKKRKVIFTDLNLNLLKQLGDLEKGVNALALKNPRLFKWAIAPKIRKQPELHALFSNTISLTGLNNEDAVINVIPHSVTALLDCRLLPGQTTEEFLENIRKRLDNDAIEIKVVHEGPHMETSRADHELYRRYCEALHNAFPMAASVSVLQPNFNDLGQFRAAGVNSFASIPVRLDREYLESIHQFDERLPVVALEEGSGVYLDFILRCMDQAAPAPVLSRK